MPSGATAGQKRWRHDIAGAPIWLYGDSVEAYQPPSDNAIKPAFEADDPTTQVYVGDCRDVLANLPEKGQVDLVFADPPFNWDVPYDQWNDGMPRAEYERFTFDWLDRCIEVLSPTGSLWVNIPDDTAAEVVVHLKRRGLTMINWCIWHFRFGQHRDTSFIMSKVHVLYFCKEPLERTWNPNDILETSDRASIYFDPRTQAKENNKGMRVPMDVWYGQYWGRIQGNNKERRHHHHNQIPEVYLERVIRACSNEGDLVLDPFLGSGTTSTVARALNRRSIGVEYAQSNADCAWERIMSGPVRLGENAKGSAIFPPRRPRPDGYGEQPGVEQRQIASNER